MRGTATGAKKIVLEHFKLCPCIMEFQSGGLYDYFKVYRL